MTTTNFENIDIESLTGAELNNYSLNDLFGVTMIMTGTPKESQRALKKMYPEMVCDCSPSRAMDCNLICRPNLNLIKICDTSALLNGVRGMIEREQSIQDIFRVKSLICCSNITIAQSINSALLADGNVHCVILHTEKPVELPNGEMSRLFAQIDGVEVPIASKKQKNVFDCLTEMDEDIYEPFNNDNKPIVVIQVDMISEGINFKSFNSVLITSTGDIKQMQQIGRVLRDCEIIINGVTYNKIEHGTANVYCTYNEMADLTDIFCGLSDNRLNGCFEWGSHCEVRTGSSPEADPNTLAKYEPVKWDKIEELPEIEEIKNCRTKGMIRKNNFSFDKMDSLMKVLNKHSDIFKEILSNKSLSKSISNLNKNHKSNKGKKSSKNSNPKETKKETKEKETTESDLRKLLGGFILKMGNMISNGGRREFVRPMFDNDRNFYREVIKEMGIPKEDIDIIDEILYDNDYYETL